MFTLKNPVYPEYTCIAPSGVMCIDFHPRRQHMIVAGLVCGNVAVFNLQLDTQAPSHMSSPKNGKHTDIVWQVGYYLFLVIHWVQIIRLMIYIDNSGLPFCII